LRGLVMGIFGLLVGYFNDVPDRLLWFGATGIIWGAVQMTDGILASIGAPREADNRKRVPVESRISGSAGVATFSVALVSSVLWSLNITWLTDATIGNIVAYITAFWAICIGIIRMVTAIRLGWEFKIVRLMVISGALLVALGTLLFLQVWTVWADRAPLPGIWQDRWPLLGICLLASGAFLLAFALQVRDRERSGQ
jgi:hypothetical protein